MELYKGYVPTKNKQCTEKFKGRKDFKTLEQVQKYPEYAGILADGVILVDFDDPGQAEIMMKICEDFQLDCRVVMTTRGKHFLFKNSTVGKCATGAKLACGLSADIKLGDRNSYQILKIDDKNRFIEWDVDPGQEYQEIPKWLIPVKTHADFIHMEAGEGRNSALYSYILTLSANGFSKAESKQCIEIINKYILKEPLDDAELEVILRDEAFPKNTFYNGKTFLHDCFAAFVQANDHVQRINGMLHCYKDGFYAPGTREIESRMIKYLPSLKATQRAEVLKYLDIRCTDNAQAADARFIAFSNGVLDIVTGELSEYTPDQIITNVIPWPYDQAAYSELADKTLDKLACGDSAIRALLEECIGYAFYRRNELSKAFVLTGEGANGKSTYLDMIKNVLGKGNYSTLDLAELDERFSVATMAGKLANIGDDISDEFLQGTAISNFKKIVSGNEVKAEFKGQDVFFFSPYVKLLFSANEIPRMKDRTNAILRRLVIVPFNARFTKDDADYDPYITWKLNDEEVMRYMVRLGVEGLKRVLENNAFTESAKVAEALQEYELQNNPILEWLQETPEEQISNQPTNDVYWDYNGYCIKNGYTAISKGNFSKELKKRCDFVSKPARIAGKLMRIYQKTKENP